MSASNVVPMPARDEHGRFRHDGDGRRKAPPHGTRARYLWADGCRCQPCRDANAAYIAAYRESQRAVVDVPLFDVAPYTVEVDE